MDFGNKSEYHFHKTIEGTLSNIFKTKHIFKKNKTKQYKKMKKNKN